MIAKPPQAIIHNISTKLFLLALGDFPVFPDRMSNEIRLKNRFGAALYPPLPRLNRKKCKLSYNRYVEVRNQVQENTSYSSSAPNHRRVSAATSYPYISEDVLRTSPMHFFCNENEDIRLLVGSDLDRGTAFTIEYVSDLPGIDQILHPNDSSTLTVGQIRLYKKFTIFLTQVHVGLLGPFRCANSLRQVDVGSEEEHACLLRGDRPIPVYRELIPSFVRLEKLLDFQLPSRSSRYRKLYHASSEGTLRASHLRDKIIYLG